MVAQREDRLRPLTDAQQQDRSFQVCDERNIDRIRQRLPATARLLARATELQPRDRCRERARFAEDQVFQPERDEFDSSR